MCYIYLCINVMNFSRKSTAQIQERTISTTDHHYWCLRITNVYFQYRTINQWIYSLKNKNQLYATYYFILLLIGSTCFWHYYAHYQELATMMFITTSDVFLRLLYVGG